MADTPTVDCIKLIEAIATSAESSRCHKHRCIQLKEQAEAFLPLLTDRHLDFGDQERRQLSNTIADLTRNLKSKLEATLKTLDLCAETRSKLRYAVGYNHLKDQIAEKSEDLWDSFSVLVALSGASEECVRQDLLRADARALLRRDSVADRVGNLEFGDLEVAFRKGRMESEAFIGELLDNGRVSESEVEDCRAYIESLRLGDRSVPASPPSTEEPTSPDPDRDRRRTFPSFYLCCICANPMLDPVCVEFGHSYCRKCIQRWFRIKLLNPRDGRLVTRPFVYDNIDLRQAVEEELKKRQPFRSAPLSEWRGLLDSFAWVSENVSHAQTSEHRRASVSEPCPPRPSARDFLDAVDRNDPYCQVYIGQYYAGVKKDLSEAARWYRKAADQGNTLGQYLLAVCYLKAWGVQKDVATGVDLLKKAAEQGLSEAEGKLGECYMSGSGVGKDFEAAVKWLERALEHAVPNGEVPRSGITEAGGGGSSGRDEVGWEASARASAARWYRILADQGEVRGQRKLGCCLLKGVGVRRNAVEGARWVRESANQGDAKGQLVLGRCYLEGSGVFKDPVEGVRWLKKAVSDHGDNGVGQYDLGMCYLRGMGVQIDDLKALRWLREAGERRGDVRAQKQVGDCYYEGRGVARDVEEAVKWYRRAAERGYGEAQYCLGRLYVSEGEEGGRPVLGLHWLRKAVDQGHVKGLYYLACCYMNGANVGKDVEEGVRLYRKGAGRACKDSARALGECYEFGHGVEKDLKEAERCYRTAAELGCQFSKGQCFENGWGVGKDTELAEQCYRVAKAQGFKMKKTSTGLQSKVFGGVWTRTFSLKRTNS